MKLLKPAFVHNEDRPIFSIDIHPKEEKFATVRNNMNYNNNISRHKLIFLYLQGGQGGKDTGWLVIWNLKPVLSEKAELDPNVPKILCQM